MLGSAKKFGIIPSFSQWSASPAPQTAQPSYRQSPVPPYGLRASESCRWLNWKCRKSRRSYIPYDWRPPPRRPCSCLLHPPLMRGTSGSPQDFHMLVLSAADIRPPEALAPSGKHCCG